MKKRILALLAAGMLTVSAAGAFAGCSKKDGGIKLTVWCAADQQDTIKSMVSEFEAANSDKEYDITVGVCDEQFAADKVGSFAATAADVYGFASDQLVPLLEKTALAAVGGTLLDTVRAENSEASVEAATFKGEVYGYPYAADNTYVMFYNKSVISENQTGKLEDIIAACNGASKKIAWGLDTPWYTAGWFFTFGGEFGVKYENPNSPYLVTSATCTFNAEETGVPASKAMESLNASGAILEGTGTDDSIIKSEFRNGTIAAAVTGTWNAKEIKNILGDNYGVCKLPTVSVEGGEAKQLYAFSGYKYFGVNRHSENLIEAHRLAAFFTSEAMQKKRFETHNTGPTNNVVAALPEVQSNPALAAVRAQAPFTRPQVSVPSGFWEPLKTYAVNVITNKVKDSNRQTLLNNMVTSILGKYAN